MADRHEHADDEVDAREPDPRLTRLIDRALSVQRPAVLAHIRGIRRRRPDAPPAEIVSALERRYLAAVTASGAAAGASAVVPGVGTGASLALSAGETALFLEATALFTQSVGEVHGLAVADPVRARALVMTMMLGKEGMDLVGQLAGQAGGGGSRSSFWGRTLVSAAPRTIAQPLVDRLRTTFLKRFATRAGASIAGRALPFGVGAVVGGAGNHVLARRVISSSRKAFGPAPESLPAELEPPRPGAVTEGPGHADD